MKSTFKRAFSRPIQLACNFTTAFCTYKLLPEHPDVMQWVAYGFIWASLLAHGLDSYSEGFDRGLKVFDALEGKP